MIPSVPLSETPTANKSMTPSSIFPSLTLSNPPSDKSNKPLHGSWEIEYFGKITPGVSPDKNEVVVSIPFNITNRDHKTTIYSGDCWTKFTGPALEAITLYAEVHTGGAGGFVQFNSTIGLNTTLLVQATERYNHTICVLTEIFLNKNQEEVVNFKKTVLSVTLDTSGSFSVLQVDAEEKNVETEEVDINYSDYLDSYQCDEDGKEVGTKTYNQGDKLLICVRSNEPSLVDVDDIRTLIVSQENGGKESFEYITAAGLDGYNNELVLKTCDGEPKVCIVRMQLLGKFFSSLNPPNLEVNGQVTLSFPGGTSRRLRVRLSNPSSNDNMISPLEEDEVDTTGFDITVNLAKSYEESWSERFGITVWYFAAGIVGAGALLI